MSASYAVIPGAGSAGLVWEPAAAELRAVVLPAPDAADVATMARTLAPEVAALPRPRVLVGSSLGAQIALEIARDVELDALVLIAAGFGIDVDDVVLDRIADNPPDLLRRLACQVVADATDESVVDARAGDFAVVRAPRCCCARCARWPPTGPSRSPTRRRPS